MRDPYTPYQQNFNAFYSYRNPYTQTPAFAYVRNNRVHNPTYYQDRAELVEAGAGLGFTAAGAALATGKISASLVGAKLAAAGLMVGSGGMIPLVGAVATLAAGTMAGAAGLRTAQVLGKHGIRGLEYLGERAFVNGGRLSSAAAKVLATTALKGTKASFKFAKQVTNSFLNKSKQSITKNMQQPQQLLGNFSQNIQGEKIFMERLNTLNKAFKKGKDIKNDLKDIFQYRIPTQKSMQALQKTTSYYFIKQNATKNNRKINLKEIQKDFKKFAKEAGLSKKEAKLFQAHIPKMVEELKDNLIVTKDNQLAPFKFHIHQSTQQIAKQKSQKVQQKFTKNQQKTLQKGKQKLQGKQQVQQQLRQNQTHQKTHTNTGYGR